MVPVRRKLQNLSFFTITGILESDNGKGYKLTGKGSEYADAITMDKPELIKKTTLEIIENSHLKDLKIFIESEGSSLQRQDLFKFVKTRANVSDGDRYVTCLRHIQQAHLDYWKFFIKRV